LQPKIRPPLLDGLCKLDVFERVQSIVMDEYRDRSLCRQEVRGVVDRIPQCGEPRFFFPSPFRRRIVGIEAVDDLRCAHRSDLNSVSSSNARE